MESRVEGGVGGHGEGWDDGTMGRVTEKEEGGLGA